MTPLLARPRPLARPRAAALAAAVLALGLAGPTGGARAQGADLVFENLQLSYGPIRYRIPRLELRGTTQSRAEIQALLDTGSAAAAAERLGRLSAREIVAPTLVSEVDGPAGRTVTTYRNLVFADVVAGRVGRASAEGGGSETPGPQGVRATFEGASASEIDLPLAAAVASEAGAPNAPLKKLYGAFALEKLSTTDPRGGTVTVDRVSGRDLLIRPTKEGWVGVGRLLSETPDLRQASPERRARVIDAVGDVLDSVAVGGLEAVGVGFSGQGGTGRIARLGYSGGPGTAPGEFRLEGLEVGSPGGRVAIGALSFGGYSVRPLIETLREGTDPSRPTTADLRRAFPLVGTTRVERVEFEAPAAAGRAGRAPTRVSVGGAEVSAGKPVGGLPTDIAVSFRNVAFALPPNPDDPGLKQAASLGYDRLDVSARASLGWDEAKSELTLRELAFEGADMGTASLKGVVGNVPKDVFDLDAAVASVALVGAAARSLEIVVENRGLAERILGRDARQRGRGVEDLRREYATMAAIGIPAALGSSAAARAIGRAVARFVARPGRLVIEAKAKSPAGFGFADFAAGPDPSSVLEQLEVTARAE